MSIQRYDFYDDSRHCTNFTHRVASRTGDFVLFTDHLTDKECELHNLLSTLADIRTALGVGDKPMLSELAGIVRTRMGVIKILERDAKDHAAEVERLTAEHNEQMAAAYNNAVRQTNNLKTERDAAVRERDEVMGALKVMLRRHGCVEGCCAQAHAVLAKIGGERG